MAEKAEARGNELAEKTHQEKIRATKTALSLGLEIEKVIKLRVFRSKR